MSAANYGEQKDHLCPFCGSEVFCTSLIGDVDGYETSCCSCDFGSPPCLTIQQSVGFYRILRAAILPYAEQWQRPQRR